MNYYCPLDADHLARAYQNVHDIVHIAIGHSDEQAALLVFDTECPLAQLLAKAYIQALPNAQTIDIAQFDNDAVMSAFAALPAGSLVILVQSTHFRLDAYRLRVQLFNQGLKVIEHVHLARMVNDEAPLYIDSLAYDAQYYRGTGAALKAKIDVAQSARIISHSGDVLHFDGPFEVAKMNIADYRLLNNIGGQFPIGEVFTEARDLSTVHGRAQVFVFGDTTFHCNWPETPITLIIESGRISATENSTPHFDDVLNKIRQVEGEVWIRELGLGLNRAFSETRRVSDIGTFERMCGIHLSLGAKHGSYNKPQFKRKDTRFHIDVFIESAAVLIDESHMFDNGQWLV